MRKLLPILLALAAVMAAVAQSIPAKKLDSMPDSALRQAGNRYLLELGKPDSALLYYSVLASRYPDPDPKRLTVEQRSELAKTLNNMGYIYMFSFYDYSRALKCLFRSQEVADTPFTTTVLNMSTIVGFYGQCFPTRENVELGIDYCRQAFQLAVKRQEWGSAYGAFNNVANCMFDPKLSNLNTAVIDSFPLLPPRPEDPEWVISNTIYSALMAMKRGNIESALGSIRQQQSLYDNDQRWHRYRCQSLWYLSQIHAYAGNTDSAMYYSRQMQSLAWRFGLKDIVMDGYDQLYRLYKTEGHHPDSMNYYQLRYFQSRDSLLVQHNLNNPNNVLVQYLKQDLTQASQQVELLKQQRRTRDIIMLVVVIGIVVVTASLVVVWRNNRKLRQRNRSLYLKNEQMLQREAKELAKKKYQGSQLDDDEKQQLRTRVEQVLSTSTEIFDEGFGMERLAALCDSSYKVISQVINETFGCSFSILLSEYRIREACRRITDEVQYGRLTIDAIGTSVGFKARSGFSVAFKRVTGLTPSEYRKVARENQG